MLDNQLPTDYQRYIHLSRYARWLDDEGRRETWFETVRRYIEFFENRLPDNFGGKFLAEFGKLQGAITDLDVMPSMRCMMTAGPALDRDNVAGYNCSYDAVAGVGNELYVLTDEMKDAGFDTPIKITANNPIAFDEMMYILLCGTGVGFSVERQYISTLPVVGHVLPRKMYLRTEANYPGVPKEELSTYDRKTRTINVADSKYGWASALRILIVELYNGNFEVQWNTSKVRPAGSRLKLFGGRASGPEPLEELFTFAVEVFKNADGRKLTSVECHDLVCKIADSVVVGGVRRSALISLSNLTDDRMRTAKSGQWWTDNKQRELANNSVSYTETPDMGIFLKEWESLYASKSGERGIFSREAARRTAARNGRRDTNHDFGTNPCSEIILRSMQFCNLTECVVRPTDTLESLKEKVRIATILGTLQSTLTDFRYLNPKWKENTEEERLLGVSLTGIMDHPVMSGSKYYEENDTPEGFDWGEWKDYKEELPIWLEELKEVAIETNRVWAARLGINPSAAITCVKPSGTVSQLVDSASGIHPRYSKFYIRTVRTDKKDPVYHFLRDQGVPVEDAIGKEDSTAVFSFPIKAPENSIMRDDMTAIEQLELWRVYAEHWCEHKPSITVYVREHEWLEVGAWVYSHFDIVSGVSFLPHSDHIYPQAPYQELVEADYNQKLADFPKDIIWEQLSNYETRDTTTIGHELACSAGGCEIL